MPVRKGAGEQNDEGSFVSMDLWLLDAPCQGDELLSQQSVLLEQFSTRTLEVDEQAAKERRAWTEGLAQSLHRSGRQFGDLGSETSSEDVEHGGSVARVAGSEPVLFGTKKMSDSGADRLGSQDSTSSADTIETTSTNSLGIQPLFTVYIYLDLPDWPLAEHRCGGYEWRVQKCPPAQPEDSPTQS